MNQHGLIRQVKTSVKITFTLTLVLTGFLLLLCSCLPDSPGQPIITPTRTPTPLNSCLPEGAEVEKGWVEHIVDGDTIDVIISGKTYRVRYIGINAPEYDAPGGSEATQRNTELTEGKDAMLVKDVSETDRYGRLLRYVFVDNVFINEALVFEGHADARAYPPDTSCQAVLNAAEAEAPQMLTGIELETPNPDTAASVYPQGCEEQQPGCAIKGNISSSGEKIYHLPGSSSYAGTVINPSKGERWFCTVEEAVSNGWRAPKD
jgi:micrococcal nuclease